MNFTLTISASPELQAVLEKLAGNTSNGWKPVGENISEPETQEPKPRKPRTPKDAAPATPPQPEVIDDGLSDEPEVAHTLESIRALGQKEAKRVGAETVRGLIKSLGCDSLPTMPADKWAEFAEKVVKLTK